MECGEVYCDRCADCIYCYGDDPCYDDGPHSYQYEGDEVWAVPRVAEVFTGSVRKDARAVILKKNVE